MSLSKNKSFVGRLWRTLRTSSSPNDSLANDQKHAKDDNKHDIFLRMENILLEEYEFNSSLFIHQVQERTTTYNFYIVLVGIFASSLGVLYQLGGNFKVPQLPVIFIFLIFIGVIHFGFFCRLAVINEIQQRCKAKMFEITTFYAQQFKGQIPEIGFVFRGKTMPKYYKGVFSMSMGCIFYGLIASICFAGAALVGGNILLGNKALFPFVTNVAPDIAAVITCLIVLLLLMPVYSIMRFYAHFRMSS